MAGALRVISIERGRDPRDFVLASFGGAGGLHVCALAERLGMRRALVPVHAGVLSALGMTVTPPTRELSRSVARALDDLSEADVAEWCRALETEAREALEADGVAADDIKVEWGMDLRYRGQTHALRLPWADRNPLDPARFHERHKAQYGHALSIPVELAHLRVSAAGPAPALDASLGRENSSTKEERAVDGGGLNVCDRHSLPLEQPVPGPLLVIDAVGSTWVAEGWSARRDEAGNIRLECRH
jgi:N-methylhydantoinase A